MQQSRLQEDSLPGYVGGKIFGMALLGIALNGVAIALYHGLCPFDARGPGTICGAMIGTPIWTALTGLASAPALLLLWHWRTVHKQAEVRIANQQQISARFAESVRLLSDREKLEARLGAIYSLERIARDSRGDRATVVETLAAFVRTYGAIDPNPEPYPDPVTGKWPSVPTDVSAAVTVIGRLGPPNPAIALDLRETDLHGLNLVGSNFQGVDFGEAVLGGANLEGANLIDADLTKAWLFQTRLLGADLSNSKMVGTGCKGADLVGATLTGADLREADLSRADLTAAVLDGARLDRCRYSSQTRFPANFQPSRHQLLEVDEKGEPVRQLEQVLG